MGIIGFLVFGLVVGALARLIKPGKQNLSILATIVLGIIGSLVGNLLGGLISGRGFELGTAGWIGSIIGAIVVLGVYVAVTGRRGARSH